TRPRFGRGVKVGHAGTLDPFATGLLLLLIGRATRVQRFVMALPKTYRAVARLGWTSDTGDRDGELPHTGRVPENLDLPTGGVVPPEGAPGCRPAVEPDPEAAARASHGGAVPGDAAEGPVRLVAGGSLIAIAERAGDGLLKPDVVLAP